MAARPVLGPNQALTHLNIGRKGGPHHSSGGYHNDQKPPDHPHDQLEYQSFEQ
jgi:hypothetical protein